MSRDTRSRTWHLKPAPCWPRCAIQSHLYIDRWIGRLNIPGLQKNIAPYLSMGLGRNLHLAIWPNITHSSFVSTHRNLDRHSSIAQKLILSARNSTNTLHFPHHHCQNFAISPRTLRSTWIGLRDRHHRTYLLHSAFPGRCGRLFGDIRRM